MRVSLVVFGILGLFCVAQADTYLVTSDADSGVGTLRWAIDQTNSHPGPDTINFDEAMTISPSSTLPEVADDSTVIDASDQWVPGLPGNPGVILDGSSITGNGLRIGASGCEIRGMWIRSFSVGIAIYSNAKNSIIGGPLHYRNVISENNTDGIYIFGADSNSIEYNFVGISPITGDSLPNGDGIFIAVGSESNYVGGNIIKSVTRGK